MPYAITDYGWRAVGDDFTEADLMPGESLVIDIPQWLYDNIAAAEVLRQAVATYNSKVSQGNAQVRAIQGRITTLNWLIYEQDPEDPDYEEPTEADSAELALLKPRLTKWNSYNNKLSKVPAQLTWPTDPIWPVMPELYTSEMSMVAPVPLDTI
jgi:hypothetical protein